MGKNKTDGFAKNWTPEIRWHVMGRIWWEMGEKGWRRDWDEFRKARSAASGKGRPTPPLRKGDVLDMRRFLEGFDGDVGDLLGDPEEEGQ